MRGPEHEGRTPLCDHHAAHPLRDGGYAARSGPAKGVHDPLFARALVLEAGGERLGMTTCDILHLERPVVEAARARARWSSPASRRSG